MDKYWEKDLEENCVSPSLKSSDKWVASLTKISRGWHITDMIGYNNKT